MSPNVFVLLQTLLFFRKKKKKEKNIERSSRHDAFEKRKNRVDERWHAITIESLVFRSEKNSLRAIDPQCHVHDTLVRIIYREREIVRFLFLRCVFRTVRVSRSIRPTVACNHVVSRACVVRSEAPNGIVFIGRMHRRSSNRVHDPSRFQFCPVGFESLYRTEA